MRRGGGAVVVVDQYLGIGRSPWAPGIGLKHKFSLGLKP